MDTPAESSEPRPLRLGDLLIRRGVLTEAELEAALAEQIHVGLPLARILADSGRVPPHALALALAEQAGGVLKTEFGFAVASPGPANPVASPSAHPEATVVPLHRPEAELRRELAAANADRAALAADAAELRRQVESLEATTAAARDELRVAVADAQDVEERRKADVEAHGRSSRTYDETRHQLLAPIGDRYELFERAGRVPEAGATVELSGAGTFRVLRSGPSPFPGTGQACAYLDRLPAPRDEEGPPGFEPGTKEL